MSLMELEREESNSGSSTNSASDTTDPSILNKTLLLVDSLGGFESITNPNEEFAGGDHATTEYTYRARNAWVISRRMLSSSFSFPERHWGSVFFLLLLWWGPALSLLVIPPRKEGSEEESISYSPENLESSFDYNGDDDFDDIHVDSVGVNERIDFNNDEVEEEEETTFLQDELPTSNSGVSPFSTKKDGVGGNRSSLEEQNFTLTQMLRTSSAWLMAWTCVILVRKPSDSYSRICSCFF